MHFHVSEIQGTPAFGIECRTLTTPLTEPFVSPFGWTHCEIPIGGQATRHSHLDTETFYFTSGSGAVEIFMDSNANKAPCKTINVAAGSVVIVPPNADHIVKNTDPKENLQFLSTYWIAAKGESKPGNFLVIPAPPTPNGPLHLGHLSGPYLSADIFARAQNAMGGQANLFVGTDDNQCYVMAKAHQSGSSGEEVVSKYKNRIHDIFKKFGLAHSFLLNPLGDSAYRTYIQKCFNECISANVFEPVSYTHLTLPTKA